MGSGKSSSIDIDKTYRHVTAYFESYGTRRLKMTVAAKTILQEAGKHALNGALFTIGSILAEMLHREAAERTITIEPFKDRTEDRFTNRVDEFPAVY